MHAGFALRRHWTGYCLGMLGIRLVVPGERVEPVDLIAYQFRDDIDEDKYGVLVFLVGLISVGASAEGWDMEQETEAVW